MQGGSSPPSVDSEALVREQANVNRVDQFTPFGNLQFFTDAEIARREDPDVPLFEESTRTITTNPDATPAQRKHGQAPQPQTSEISGFRNVDTGEFVRTLPGGAVLRGDEPPSNAILELSPEQQAQFEARNRLSSNLLSGAEDLSGSLFGMGEQLPGGRTQAQNAVFERARNLLEPQFERQEDRLRQTLANQGLPTGGEAFNSEFGQFNQDRNRAFEDAAFRAVGAGNAREGQQFNQLASLLGREQAQAPGLGQFFGPSQVDVTGPAGLQQQAGLAQFNANQQTNQAQMGALASLGTAAIMACSRDYKTNKRPVEQILPRMDLIRVEAWDYKDGYGDGGTHIGPYAEDFQKAFGVGDGKSIPVIDAFGVLFMAVQELKARTEVAHG